MNDSLEQFSGMLQCPKESGLFYFYTACDTIIRPSGLRPWCKACHHFVAEAKQLQVKEETLNKDESDAIE